MYRRSCFPRNHIKRLMQATANCAVAQQVCIAMSGIAKVYVGEIVEEALRVAVSPSIYTCQFLARIQYPISDLILQI